MIAVWRLQLSNKEALSYAQDSRCIVISRLVSWGLARRYQSAHSNHIVERELPKRNKLFYSYHNTRTGQRYRASPIRIPSICLAQKLEYMFVVEFKIGIFEVLFKLVNEADAQIRAQRQGKRCYNKTRKAFYRMGYINVNDDHGGVLFAVCTSN